MVLLSDDVSLMGMGSSDQSILEVRRLGTLSSASLPSSDLGIQLYWAPKVNLEKVLCRKSFAFGFQLSTSGFQHSYALFVIRRRKGHRLSF
jgi:hypothetical protein